MNCLVLTTSVFISVLRSEILGRVIGRLFTSSRLGRRLVYSYLPITSLNTSGLIASFDKAHQSLVPFLHPRIVQMLLLHFAL